MVETVNGQVVCLRQLVDLGGIQAGPRGLERRPSTSMEGTFDHVTKSGTVNYHALVRTVVVPPHTESLLDVSVEARWD